jgi:hypothetical protein
VPARRLLEVDLRIAQIREDVARGHASEVAQIELNYLLKEREALIKSLASEPRRDIDASN